MAMEANLIGRLGSDDPTRSRRRQKQFFFGGGGGGGGGGRTKFNRKFFTCPNVTDLVGRFHVLGHWATCSWSLKVCLLKRSSSEISAYKLTK